MEEENQGPELVVVVEETKEETEVEVAEERLRLVGLEHATRLEPAPGNESARMSIPSSSQWMYFHTHRLESVRYSIFCDGERAGTACCVVFVALRLAEERSESCRICFGGGRVVRRGQHEDEDEDADEEELLHDACGCRGSAHTHLSGADRPHVPSLSRRRRRRRRRRGRSVSRRLLFSWLLGCSTGRRCARVLPHGVVRAARRARQRLAPSPRPTPGPD